MSCLAFLPAQQRTGAGYAMMRGLAIDRTFVERGGTLHRVSLDAPARVVREAA
jgi:hypothetical protein